MNRGFTLIELLIVVCIIAILAALLFGVGGYWFWTDAETGNTYYGSYRTGQFQCVDKYPVSSNSGNSTSKRVILKSLEDGGNETFLCDDDVRGNIHNSATLYGEFEEGGKYTVTYIGFRREGWFSCFPLVKSVSRLAD